MKKSLILIAVLFLAIGIANASSASLTVDIPRYDPYPAEPGKYLDVWVKVENIGSATADNVMIELTPEFPFSLDPNEDGLADLGAIPAGKTEIIKFKVRVNENAVQGDNSIGLKYKYTGYDWLTKEIDIFVQTHDAILSVKKIYTSPENMIQGRISTVVFELENMADSFLSNINIKMDLTNSSIPFAPVNSTTEKRIYVIEAGETKNVEFNIIASPDADSGIYKVPIEISYSDNTGAEYIRTDIVGLIVGDKPKLDVYVDESEILGAGESGTVKLVLINGGLTDLKFMNVELVGNGNFETLSPHMVYVGDLDSDDTDTVNFKIYVKSTGEKYIDLPLEIKYLDSNNIEYLENIDVPLRLYSGSEISQYNLRASSGSGWLIGLIIIGIGGFVFYKYYWKKRK